MHRTNVLATVLILMTALAAAVADARSACAGGARLPSGGTDATRQHRSPTKPAVTPSVARYRVRDASTVDLGWTGMAHHQPWPGEQRLEFAVDCGAGGASGDGASGRACTVSGGATGTIFGAPVPLSTGGVPACVVSRLRAPLAGTVDPGSGCGELRLALTATVYMGGEVAQPCPRCDGDRAPNDGRKDGRCVGGASSGSACDANAASTLFGATSNDCLPLPASAVGALAIDVAPLTTGSVRLVADGVCALRRPGVGTRCACAQQWQPNACDTGTCGADELCEAPVDGVCTGAPFRGCTLGSEERECEAVARGAGTCAIRVRPCFGDVIGATGSCDRERPTYVAIFCAPGTQASAINTTAGLPGPARLRLALEVVTPRSKTPRGGGRSPARRRVR